MTLRGTPPIKWGSYGFPVMQSVLPPGRHGNSHISHFSISEEEARDYNLRSMMSTFSGMSNVEPGDYVRVYVGREPRGDPDMSDTPMERRTNMEVRRMARGRCLIAGLGIGMILHPILDPKRHTPTKRDRFLHPRVDHVTVIERDPDVIALVGPSLARYGDRITIVESDIHAFTPGKGEKFDTVYFDIWPVISEDNLKEIADLHQRWKSRLNRAGEVKPWMHSWMDWYLRAERRRYSERYGW